LQLRIIATIAFAAGQLALSGFQAFTQLFALALQFFHVLRRHCPASFGDLALKQKILRQ
jgi:hypothetical protein